jgi:hypothetical protein
MAPFASSPGRYNSQQFIGCDAVCLLVKGEAENPRASALKIVSKTAFKAA